MNILLYKTTNANNDLNKTISDKVELVGALRDVSSIIAPSILIQSNPIGYNYAYIPEFGRYYYIKNITAFRNGAYIVDLKCDVLMSIRKIYSPVCFQTLCLDISSGVVITIC